jgi:phage head maturation protease
MKVKTAAGAALDVRVKTVDLRVKEAGSDDGLAEGEFIAYASAFGNVDSYGDIVDDTFFDRTLDEWAKSGDTIPVLWGHDLFDPFNNIGGVKEATVVKMTADGADDEGAKADGESLEKPGLKIHAFLDLENPTAAQVYRLMKGRRTTKMSFAYSVNDEEQKDDGNHLKDGDLYEVSVVQIPANQEAEILTVKAALAPFLKAGRVLSSKNEAALREARDAISSVLESLESDSEGSASGSSTSKASGQPEDRASDKGPSGTEEKRQGPSVADDALLQSMFDAVAGSPAEGA